MVRAETITPDLSRSALRSLDVIRGVFSMARTNLRRHLRSIFLLPPHPRRFLTIP
ncbi:hypothetical protein AAFF_G00210630 [Aldrovandia affinis]|uniref:Uncharacterized protein n=1 Tax=Aldrovandia affinis TaxID=143900 RepID=A0AAD7WUS6_9TELE|nr:hypothetical protein AAFF_G00210630 [Aldrovandia affinis]